MKFINGWKATTKQVDKFDLHLRFGWVTVFEVYSDWSDKKWRVGAFNFFVGN